MPSIPPKRSSESTRSSSALYPQTTPIPRLSSRDSIRRKPVPSPTSTSASASTLTLSPATISTLRPSFDTLGSSHGASTILGTPHTPPYSAVIPPLPMSKSTAAAYGELGLSSATAVSPQSGTKQSSASTVSTVSPWKPPAVTIRPDQLGSRIPTEVASPVPRTVITRPREREAAESGWRRVVRDWQPEIIGCVVTVGCLVVMVAISSAFNGHPISSLPAAITFNTILQFPLSIAITSLVFSISSCISQWKWLWFDPAIPHPTFLSDFHRFDTASRHPFGSLTFLRHFRLTTPASFGALLLLLAVITAPVTQLAITYADGFAVVPDGTARVSVLQGFGNGTSDDQMFRDTAKFGVLNWQMDNRSDVLRDVLAVECLSGTCVFPQVTALGLCAHVEDISGRLSRQGTSVRLTNLSDCVLEASNVISLIACKTHESQTFSSQAAGSVTIYSMAVIFNTPGTGDTVSFHALEATFSVCENSYDVSITNNISSILPVTSQVLTSTEFAGVQVNCTLPDDQSSMALCRTGINNGVAQLLKSDGSGSYSVPYSTLESVALAINPSICGYWSNSSGSLIEIRSDSDSGLAITSLVRGSASGNEANTSKSAINAPQMESIAEALFGASDVSIHMGSVVLEGAKAGLGQLSSSIVLGMNAAIFNDSTASTTSSIFGTPLTPSSVIIIVWPALILILFQTLGTIVFLIITIIATSRHKTQSLKSSAMAQLVALNESTRKVLGGLDEVDMLNRKAKVLEVVREEDSLVLSVTAAAAAVPKTSRSTTRQYDALRSVRRNEGVRSEV